MTGRFFVDTNLLVYSHDPQNPAKRAAAQTMIGNLAATGSGVISTQVLGEFYSVAVRKMRIPESIAQSAVIAFAGQFEVAEITARLVLEAIHASLRFRINFWDAQVWAAAKAMRAPIILSEDLQDGATLDGVRIMNPFRGDVN